MGRRSIECFFNREPRTTKNESETNREKSWPSFRCSTRNEDNALVSFFLAAVLQAFPRSVPGTPRAGDSACFLPAVLAVALRPRLKEL